MKKSILKFVSLFFALSFVFAMCVPAFAITEPETVFEEYTDEEEIRAFVENDPTELPTAPVIASAGNDVLANTESGTVLNEISDETVTTELTTAYETVSAEEGKKTDIAKKLIISLVIGLIIGLIVASVLKSSLKSVAKQSGASNYIEEGSFNLVEKEDVFLYKKEEKTPIPKQEPPKK